MVIAITYGTSHFGWRVNFRLPLPDPDGGHEAGTMELAIVLHPNEYASREARVVTHKWKITRGFRSPDGVKKLVYLINGIRL